MAIADKLTELLDAVNNSSVYADIKKQYEDGIIDRKMYESFMINFHSTILPSALQMAKELSIIEESVEVDGVSYTEQQANVRLKVAQIEGEKERNSLLHIQTTHEEAKLLKDLEILEQQRLREVESNSLLHIQATHEEAKLLKDLEILEQQRLSEVERTGLLANQKIGFLDNRVIKLTEEIRGLVGEIESGGLSNPQANWDMLYASLGAMAKLAEDHPEVGTIAVPATPPAPQH